MTLLTVVAVATPKVGVTRVGEVASTTEPVPVGEFARLRAQTPAALGVQAAEESTVPSPSTAPITEMEVFGKVIVVLSVPARVSELLAVRVLPFAMVRVALVAGAVMATLESTRSPLELKLPRSPAVKPPV